MSSPRRPVALLQGFLWHGLCQVAYWTGVGPLLAWISRRQCADSWTVLGYHRVGEPNGDGGPDHVTPERLRQHLRYVRRRYEVVTVGEALERLGRSRTRRRPMLSITFDDGYRDNLQALPILLQEGCRATLYPTLEAIEEDCPPWPHRLATDLRRLARATGPARANGSTETPEILGRFVAQAPRLSERELMVRIGTLVAVAKKLPEHERRLLCGRVSEMADGRNEGDRLMLTSEDLKEWHSSGMEVGSHTCRHPILSRLQGSERRADLARSRWGLERILGVPVVHLAYPNGRVGDWDEGTIEDVRGAGFVSAVTTVEGLNRSELDRYRIRRISIGNDALPAFATRVSPLGARVRAWLRNCAPRRAARPAGDRSRRGAEPSLRIAFIGGRGVGSAYSGIERYYEEVGSRLAALGHRVLVYCRPHFSPADPHYRELVVRRLPTIRSKHLETLVHTILATIDVSFRRVDLVQFHALGSSPFSWIPRLAGKRTIVSVRGLDWQRAKWGFVARTYLRFCEMTSLICPNATAVVSRTLQEHFQRRFGRPVRYIPNGVARTERLPPEGIRRWGLGERDFFLYAGRLSPEKRLEVMIAAHRSIPGLGLALAGGSSYSDGYMDGLRASAGNRVVFTGLVTGTLLQELYSNALAFVLPSRMEGLSVALLEAMSYGLPVIASDIPENRELVDECGGYLFHLDDVEDLSRVMRGVAASRDESRRVGERARDVVRARFDWDRIAAETADFYRSVMASSGIAPAGQRATPTQARVPGEPQGGAARGLDERVGGRE